MYLHVPTIHTINVWLCSCTEQILLPNTRVNIGDSHIGRSDQRYLRRGRPTTPRSHLEHNKIQTTTNGSLQSNTTKYITNSIWGTPSTKYHIISQDINNNTLVDPDLLSAIMSGGQRHVLYH